MSGDFPKLMKSLMCTHVEHFKHHKHAYLPCSAIRDGEICVPKEPLQQLRAPKSSDPTKIIAAVGLLRKLKDCAVLQRERFFINMQKPLVTHLPCFLQA